MIPLGGISAVPGPGIRLPSAGEGESWDRPCPCPPSLLPALGIPSATAGSSAQPGGSGEGRMGTEGFGGTFLCGGGTAGMAWHGMAWQGVARELRTVPCRRQMCRCSRRRPLLLPVFGK